MNPFPSCINCQQLSTKIQENWTSYITIIKGVEDQLISMMYAHMSYAQYHSTKSYFLKPPGKAFILVKTLREGLERGHNVFEWTVTKIHVKASVFAGKALFMLVLAFILHIFRFRYNLLHLSTISRYKQVFCRFFPQMHTLPRISATNGSPWRSCRASPCPSSTSSPSPPIMSQGCLTTVSSLLVIILLLKSCDSEPEFEP